MKDWCVTRRMLVVATVVGVLLLAAACGYHTGAKAVRLPTSLQTIYVPQFANLTQTYRINETLTTAVIQELRSRTNYRVVTANDGTADATLNGAVTRVSTGALTYDPIKGTISSSMVVINMRISLVDRKGKILWDNPSLLFREQYQSSSDPGSFFSEESPAVQRVARDFSRGMVSDLLEAY